MSFNSHLSSSTSRIPLSSSSDSYALSSSFRKRDAAEAFDDNPPRRTSGMSSGSMANLQRQLLDLKEKLGATQDENTELRSECNRLKMERKLLHDGEKSAISLTEEKENAWSEERQSLFAKVKEYRISNDSLSNKYESERRDHDELKRKHSALLDSTKVEISDLRRRNKDAEDEVTRLKGFERRAKGLAIDLEEERRRAIEGRTNEQYEQEDKKTDATMRAELKRQAGHLSTLERNYSAAQVELESLRKRKKEFDASERAMKDVERALREEIRSLHDQLDSSRRDMESLTQTFPSSSGDSELEQRLQALSALHIKATAEVTAKKAEISDLNKRLHNLAADSFNTNQALAKQLAEMTTECRWAKEGRAAAERMEKLAKQEIEAARAGPSMPGAISGDQSGRVRQLERLVDQYKSELEAISRDSRDVEDRLTSGAGLVKQSALDEAVEEISRLTADVEALEATINSLTSANTTLDAEVNDLMRRVASGEYNPATERCIELKDNPSSRIKAIRQKELDELRLENGALLERLAKASVPVDGEGSVPLSSFERLKAEKEQLEVAHAKRLQRLKEIFGTKSKEFLEAVYSLLGWRIKFDESGADIRLTSMYAPKGKMGLTLKFASQEGHFGTMQMTGALARGLEDTRHFWITERQSVPGFLAQITTEMFEKTTMGRAAGYVGFE